MFEYDYKQHVPRFILNDKNGYALARAIAAGLQKLNDIIEEGVFCVIDSGSMPEWRLDEMAWETNCIYDYSASVETKRKLIEKALPLYRLYGTPQAIYEYFSSYYDSVQILENWDYGGEPYHFKILVENEKFQNAETWNVDAIKKTKNVRSVLDGFLIGYSANLKVSASGEVLARIEYPLTGTGYRAGELP
ncbi:MAG: phage tail protein [Lachnospiraceae bacterium]|nr:phage tail protein [Lachnospiraceae bacterium]